MCEIPTLSGYGIDRDQSCLAPNNVLIFTMKTCNNAVDEVSKEIMDGKKFGGTTISLGLAENKGAGRLGEICHGSQSGMGQLAQRNNR